MITLGFLHSSLYDALWALHSGLLVSTWTCIYDDFSLPIISSCYLSNMVSWAMVFYFGRATRPLSWSLFLFYCFGRRLFLPRIDLQFTAARPCWCGSSPTALLGLQVIQLSPCCASAWQLISLLLLAVIYATFLARCSASYCWCDSKAVVPSWFF